MEAWMRFVANLFSWSNRTQPWWLAEIMWGLELFWNCDAFLHFCIYCRKSWRWMHTFSICVGFSSSCVHSFLCLCVCCTADMRGHVWGFQHWPLAKGFIVKEEHWMDRKSRRATYRWVMCLNQLGGWWVIQNTDQQEQTSLTLLLIKYHNLYGRVLPDIQTHTYLSLLNLLSVLWCSVSFPLVPSSWRCLFKLELAYRKGHIIWHFFVVKSTA